MQNTIGRPKPTNALMRCKSSPCKDCKERSAECHSACERYKSWTNNDLAKAHQDLRAENSIIWARRTAYERACEQALTKSGRGGQGASRTLNLLKKGKIH